VTALDTRMYDFEAATSDGRPVAMRDYRGKVLLIVNVASRCGYTPQYEGLERLYRKYQAEGFVVLGFPCNQFGNQEPGLNTEIQEFCQEKYGVTFPVHAKVDVNGPHAHPLFGYLTSSAPGWLGIRRIWWNFTKFLVDREGRVVRRFGPKDTPDAIEPHIATVLKK
jgi:glutathione peroxidase